MAARKKSATKGISKAVANCLAILLLLLVVGFISFFTNGFTTDFKTFYVNVRGETILINKSGYELAIDEEYRFDVKYTFDFLSNNKSRDYTVEVLPFFTEKNNFDFFVDGQVYSFLGEIDVSAGFEIDIKENYFTIKNAADLPAIIQANYPNSIVTGVPNAVDSNIDYFKLIIYSEDNLAQIEIVFQLCTFRVYFDKDNVVF